MSAPFSPGRIIDNPHGNPGALGVGVDFGTSNSTIAWFDGRELHLAGVGEHG